MRFGMLTRPTVVQAGRTLVGGGAQPAATGGVGGDAKRNPSGATLESS